MGHPIKLTRPKPECQTQIPAPDDLTIIQTGKPPHGDSTKLTRSDHRSQPRLTSPATTPNNPETNPDHPTQLATLRQPARFYPTTTPKSNPDLSGYTLQTHHIHGQPKEERQNHTPTKPPRKPGQPRKDSVYITHLSRKNKIVLMRADVERRTCGSALVAWCAPPPVGLLAP